jgi:hypothetical protein
MATIINYYFVIKVAWKMVIRMVFLVFRLNVYVAAYHNYQFKDTRY